MFVMEIVLMPWIRFRKCRRTAFEERIKYKVGVTRIPRKQPTPTHTHKVVTCSPFTGGKNDQSTYFGLKFQVKQTRQKLLQVHGLQLSSKGCSNLLLIAEPKKH